MLATSASTGERSTLVSFAGQTVGIREVSEKIWLVSFETCRIDSAANPFAAKLLLALNGSSKHLTQVHGPAFSRLMSPGAGCLASWQQHPAEPG